MRLVPACPGISKHTTCQFWGKYCRGKIKTPDWYERSSKEHFNSEQNGRAVHDAHTSIIIAEVPVPWRWVARSPCWLKSRAAAAQSVWRLLVSRGLCNWSGSFHGSNSGPPFPCWGDAAWGGGSSSSSVTSSLVLPIALQLKINLKLKKNVTFVQYAEKMYWVCLPFPCFDQSSRTEEVEGSECDEEESKGSE